MFWLLMPHQMPDYSGFLCLHSAVSFVVQGIFNFTQTPINYCCYFLGSFSESPCLSHDLKVFPSSSRNSGLTVRSLTQFELIFLCIDICVDLVSSLYMWETQLSTQHLLKRGLLYEKAGAEAEWISIVFPLFTCLLLLSLGVACSLLPPILLLYRVM